MSSGYGNHEPPRSGAGASTPAEKPGPGSTDRQGLDFGGSGDVSAIGGATGGSHASPDPSGVGPHSGRKPDTPVLTEAEDVATPGTGALPTDPQAGDADPGTG